MVWRHHREVTMSENQQKAETIERSEAINRLRTELLKRTDSETSICKVATEQGIFCRGFVRFGDAELRENYDWITRRRPKMTREELEDIANRWQVARQDYRQLPLACDVQRREHDMCRGWDDFTNDDLSRFHFELLGYQVAVI
jgi:hypothetical protein